MNALDVQALKVAFLGHRTLPAVVQRERRPAALALDGIDLSIERGAIVGIVGESGCGKTTLARCLAGMQRPTTGTVALNGCAVGGERSREQRRRVQMVFQDPYSSLNPRMTIGQTLEELLTCPKDRRRARALELLGLVGLDTRVVDARPRELSGGERQRASIARALAVEPEVLVADEPVSALDVSVQATVLNLLADIRARLGTTIVLISHDLAVVSHLCDRVAVMYLGRIVEEGAAIDVLTRPQHPYTRALLAAVPRRGGDAGMSAALSGELPGPFDIPAGCRFRSRCPVAVADCAATDPRLRLVGERSLVACLRAPIPATREDQCNA